MHIGKKIRLLRGVKGMTQEDLAEKVSKTRSLISYIEQTGKANEYTLSSIARALDVSISELESVHPKLQGEDEPSASAYSKYDEVEKLKKELENCQKENLILKELIASQKKIIDMMERRK